MEFSLLIWFVLIESKRTGGTSIGQIVSEDCLFDATLMSNYQILKQQFR